MSGRFNAKPLRHSYREISPHTWRTRSPTRNWWLAVDRSVLSKLGSMPVDQVGTAAAAAPGDQMRSPPKNRSVGRPSTDATLGRQTTDVSRCRNRPSQPSWRRPERVRVMIGGKGVALSRAGGRRSFSSPLTAAGLHNSRR